LKATPRIRSESCRTRKRRKRNSGQLRTFLSQSTPLADSTTTHAFAHLHSSSGHLLGSDEVLVEIVLVEAKDGVDDHGREERLLRVDELRGHGGGGEEVEVLLEDSVGRQNKGGKFSLAVELENEGGRMRTNSGLDLSMGTAISLIFWIAWGE
jgi:hypothetical protein